MFGLKPNKMNKAEKLNGHPFRLSAFFLRLMAKARGDYFAAAFSKS